MWSLVLSSKTTPEITLLAFWNAGGEREGGKVESGCQVGALLLFLRMLTRVCALMLVCLRRIYKKLRLDLFPTLLVDCAFW